MDRERSDTQRVCNAPFYDAHVHMVLAGHDWKTAIDRHRAAPDEGWVRRTLAAYAEAGAVYLREGGDRFGACELACRLAREYGIEYASPVFPIYQKGNYGGFIGRAFETFEDFRDLVGEVARRGGTYVKVMLTGIMDFDEYGVVTGYALDRSLVGDMAACCHAKGLPVMAHVNGARAVQCACECGIDSIEHGYYTDADARAAMVEHGAVWVPTLSPVANLIGTGVFPDEVLGRILEGQEASVKEVVEAGGVVAAGSDAGASEVPHVDGMRTEFAHMRRAIGSGADAAIARGFAAMRERFPGA